MAFLTGNRITANGTYDVPVFPGQTYVVSAAGTYDSGTLAISWVDDSGNVSPFDLSPLTSGETRNITAPTRLIRLTLTGATSPEITIGITPAGKEAGGGGLSEEDVENKILTTPVWPPYDSIPASAGGTGLRPLPEGSAWFEVEFDTSSGYLILPAFVDMPPMWSGDGTYIASPWSLPYDPNSPRPIENVVNSPTQYVTQFFYFGPSFWPVLKLEGIDGGVFARSGGLGEVTLGLDLPYSSVTSTMPLPNTDILNGNILITDFDYIHATVAGCPQWIDLPNAAMGEAAVDALLAHLVACGKYYGQLVLDGSYTAAPSAAGLASKATLVSRGWIVDTN